MVEPWRAVVASLLLVAAVVVVVFRRQFARAAARRASGDDGGDSSWVRTAGARVQGRPWVMVWNAAVLTAMAAMVFFGEQGRCWLRGVC